MIYQVDTGQGLMGMKYVNAYSEAEAVAKAEDMLEAIEEAENERLEQEYIKKYGSMEE